MTDTDVRGDTDCGRSGQPVPLARDFKRVSNEYTEGPNIEASPWELEAARGEAPLEGPRPDDALDWSEFIAAVLASRCTRYFDERRRRRLTPTDTAAQKCPR